MSDIRVATIDDAEGIAFVHVNAWMETYHGLMPDSVLDGLSVEQRTTVWHKRLKDKVDVYHQVVVAEFQKEIVGFAGYGIEQSNDPDFHGELYAIYVLKRFQGGGIGRALVKHSASELLAQNISSMLVWVLANNPYQKFYERLGGVYLREKTVELGGELLKEKAYGWKDVSLLAGAKR